MSQALHRQIITRAKSHSNPEDDSLSLKISKANQSKENSKIYGSLNQKTKALAIILISTSTFLYFEIYWVAFTLSLGKEQGFKSAPWALDSKRKNSTLGKWGPLMDPCFGFSTDQNAYLLQNIFPLPSFLEKEQQQQQTSSKTTTIYDLGDSVPLSSVRAIIKTRLKA